MKEGAFNAQLSGSDSLAARCTTHRTQHTCCPSSPPPHKARTTQSLTVLRAAASAAATGAIAACKNGTRLLNCAQLSTGMVAHSDMSAADAMHKRDQSDACNAAGHSNVMYSNAGHGTTKLFDSSNQWTATDALASTCWRSITLHANSLLMPCNTIQC